MRRNAWRSSQLLLFFFFLRKPRSSLRIASTIAANGARPSMVVKTLGRASSILSSANADAARLVVSQNREAHARTYGRLVVVKPHEACDDTAAPLSTYPGRDRRALYTERVRLKVGRDWGRLCRSSRLAGRSLTSWAKQPACRSRRDLRRYGRHWTPACRLVVESRRRVETGCRRGAPSSERRKDAPYGRIAMLATRRPRLLLQRPKTTATTRFSRKAGNLIL